jgi:hypothetical protein
VVSAIFFMVYPVVLESHGWAGVWRMVAGMVLVSTVCIVAQQKLEGRR